MFSPRKKTCVKIETWNKYT